MNVLVTGGCGYVGSHMVRALVGAGHRVVVLDDLSHGHRETVPVGVDLVVGDVRDRAKVMPVLTDGGIGAIFHFAARIEVGESMVHPRLYFRDNLGASIELLESALDAKVSRFVLSSTAAVYGSPLRIPIDEDHPQGPISPYGETKLAIERILARYGAAYGLRWAALRYFNAAGGLPGLGLGERHEPETHLIPLVLDAALGKRPQITVFGTDYPTPDGTCVRDYVHVADLAHAHLLALDYLEAGGSSGAFNLGTGEGHSVRQVIDEVERVAGRRVPVAIGPRREGDPPVLVASPERANRVLGWRATRSSLEQIVRDAWACRDTTGAPP
jgi:UDP-glucose 4-epimerase